MTKSGWCFVPSSVMIRSPVLKALSLSLSFYRKIDNQGLGDRANRSCNNCLFSIGGYWRFGSEYSDNFFAFLRCVFEWSKLSTKDVSERIEFGVLGNRYKCTPCFNCIHVVGWSKFLMTIVAHSKSNDWELYCRVIYTGEVRERQKVFERSGGKKLNFQFVSWPRKCFSSRWVGCRNMMVYGMAPTYFYHVNDWKLSCRVIATKTFRHRRCSFLLKSCSSVLFIYSSLFEQVKYRNAVQDEKKELYALDGDWQLMENGYNGLRAQPQVCWPVSFGAYIVLWG